MSLSVKPRQTPRSCTKFRTKTRQNPRVGSVCWWQNVAMPQKAIRRQLFKSVSTRLKTACQWQMSSAFAWCRFRWPWAACPTTARAGGSKRTCFPSCCPCPRTRHNCFCPVFSCKFNIITALSVHQSPTLPQKIDSREGLFWCKKGLPCACDKMNIYLKTPPFAPILGLFAAKYSAFWC